MTHQRLIPAGLVLVAFLVLSGPVVEAKGFYFGGSLGQTDAHDLDLTPIADGSVLAGGTDATDTGWKIFGGLKVFRFMNAEFGYRDYGQVSFLAMSDGTGTVYSAGPLDALGDTTAVSVSAMVLLPAGRFTFFAKGGLARWRTETTVQHSMGNVAMIDSDGVDTMYGVGLAWKLKKSMGIRAEYERIAVTAADRDFISAGVHFRF
jgi:hypothetical protein